LFVGLVNGSRSVRLGGQRVFLSNDVIVAGTVGGWSNLGQFGRTVGFSRLFLKQLFSRGVDYRRVFPLPPHLTKITETVFGRGVCTGSRARRGHELFLRTV